MKKQAQATENTGINIMMGAFNALGGEIKSLKEQLIMKERLAALGEVAAGIAHEFRNPMGVIAGYARLLLKGFDETDNRKEIVQAILNEIEEMNRVMEELLKFSTAEPINRIDIELSSFIKDIIKGMGEKASEISFSSGDGFSVKGDKTLLRQAVKNPVQNAVDAGDEININVEKTHMSGREGVSIAINDNGKGIPETDLNKIFMPFYTTKSGVQASGWLWYRKLRWPMGDALV